jgi:dsRNA-specific ribonuclease
LLEASLAALYLQHGFEPIREAVVAAFDGPDHLRADDPRRPQDRAPGGARPPGAAVVYNVLDVKGRRTTAPSAAPRDRRREVGVGTGSSKKAAEQAAAEQALDRLAGAA